MKKENTWFNQKFLGSKIAAFLVMLGGTATVTGCTALLHEKKVPDSLLENNQFTSED